MQELRAAVIRFLDAVLAGVVDLARLGDGTARNLARFAIYAITMWALVQVAVAVVRLVGFGA